MKKGVFFTIDSIIGAGILFVVIVFTSSLYVEEQPSFHLNYLSQDVIRTLSILTVQEVDNDYIDSLIDGGTITNLDNTILEQIIEFWVDDQITFANDTTRNVTNAFIPDIDGFGLWIDDESIYQRDVPIEKSLISSKKMISGKVKGQSDTYTRQNPPTLSNPAVVEVRVWQ
tara:strand:- start:564 stop:1076 length:513 start_codon:yes stop_codon:yes gene_type:complete